MKNEGKKYSVNVYIETENRYFSAGLIYLIAEIFNDEGHYDAVVSLVSEVDAADLVVQFNAPGEKASGWIDCKKFQRVDHYKMSVLNKKWVSVYLDNKHHNRYFHCPMVDSIVALRDSVAEIRQRLYSVFFGKSRHGPHGPQNLPSTNCGSCIGEYPLTVREQQIINYYQQGLVSSEVANLMKCSIKSLSNHRRAIMSKLHICKQNDFISWLGTKFIAEKYADAIGYHSRVQDNEQPGWLLPSIEGLEEVKDEKKRVIFCMQNLIKKHSISNQSSKVSWLTTREIANETNVSIYSIRYLLNQMKNDGYVACIAKGRGKNNTLLWRLVE